MIYVRADLSAKQKMSVNRLVAGKKVRKVVFFMGLRIVIVPYGMIADFQGKKIRK